MNTSTYIRALRGVSIRIGESKQLTTWHPWQRGREAAKVEHDRRIRQAAKLEKKILDDVVWLYQMVDK